MIQKFLAVLILLILTLLFTPNRAGAQTGAYVNPRPFVLWSGTLTNGQSLTNVFTGTNFLNYSGFHRLGIWMTWNQAFPTNAGLLAPNGASAGTNGTVTLGLNFSPGTGNSYSNSVLGTNSMFTTGTNTAFTWVNGFQGNGGTNNNQPVCVFTNLDWQWADAVLYLRGSRLSTTTTNAAGINLQIDAVVVP